MSAVTITRCSLRQTHMPMLNSVFFLAGGNLQNGFGHCIAISQYRW